MFDGYCVEAVEDLDVDDEGNEGESEKDGDHEPGAAEIVGQCDDDEGDSEACNEDAQGDKDTELGGLSASWLQQVDFFRSREGPEVADGAVDEGGEEKPADG